MIINYFKFFFYFINCTLRLHEQSNDTFVYAAGEIELIRFKLVSMKIFLHKIWRFCSTLADQAVFYIGPSHYGYGLYTKLA